MSKEDKKIKRLANNYSYHLIFKIMDWGRLLTLLCFLTYFTYLTIFMISHLATNPYKTAEFWVVLSLLTFFVFAIGALVGFFFAKPRYVEEADILSEPASMNIANHLDLLINDAVNGGSDAIDVNAAAIVAARDGHRKTLMALHGLLNSEIDKLKDQLEGGDTVALKKRVAILSKIWPAKMDQIKYEIAKLQVEINPPKRG